MNRWIWLICWIATIFAGAGISTVVPEQFVYITGFITGTFSFMFMRLFDHYKR